MVFGKTLEIHLDCKKIKPVSPKGNQSRIFFGGTDGEAEAPILWPPDVKSWLTGKKSLFWERLKVGGEGDNRGWDVWFVSPNQWTWIWTCSVWWWRTRMPGVLFLWDLKELDMSKLKSKSNWMNNSSLKYYHHTGRRLPSFSSMFYSWSLLALCFTFYILKSN